MAGPQPDADRIDTDGAAASARLLAAVATEIVAVAP
jgi:hypothetical protein